MHNVQAVILAGGLATRMGGVDKGLLQLHGRPILAEVIERIAPQVNGVVLNANGDPARFSEYGLPVIADSKQGFLGPLAGVLAAMEWATGEGSEWVVSVAADTPFFPVDLVARLHEAAEEHASPVALAASYDLHNASYMRHPTFGLWHVSLQNVLAQALDDGVRKIVRWTDSVGGVEVRFEREATEPDPFFNVNTPQELEIAEMMRMS